MKKILSAGVALAFFPAIALADPATIQQLTVLHNQVAILTQQLAAAKLQGEIAQAGGASSTPAPFAGGAAAPAAPIAPANTLPTVVSIMGGGDRLTATLQTSTGTQLVVSPGQALPGGLTVYRINSDGVSVMQAGNIVPLSFVGAAAAPSGSTPSNATAISLPPSISTLPSGAPLPGGAVLPPLKLPGSN
jgi:type IV pilus biogenesis protein PilP